VSSKKTSSSPPLRTAGLSTTAVKYGTALVIAAALTAAGIGFRAIDADMWSLVEPGRIGRPRLIRLGIYGGKALVWHGQGGALIRRECAVDEIPAAVVAVARAVIDSDDDKEG
jgi:hypothetical protein